MRFIQDHKDQFAVALLLRVLNINASTYYGWRRQETDPCQRAEVDRGLLSNIYEIWDTSGRTYGADRVHRQLRRDGMFVGRNRVERLMAAQGWQGAYLRRGWKNGQSSTRQNPAATPAPDLVNRNFTANAPNQLWVADATRIPAEKECSGWPPSATSTPARSSAGRPPTAATPTSSWARSSTPSGPAKAPQA